MASVVVATCPECGTRTCLFRAHGGLCPYCYYTCGPGDDAPSSIPVWTGSKPEASPGRAWRATRGRVPAFAGWL